MILKCEKCETDFDNPDYRAYCVACVIGFEEIKRGITSRQQIKFPSGTTMFLDGAIVDAKECPKTFTHPVSGKQVCGLCGSDSVDSGYGLGSGYGMGTYTFCMNCNTFLDFCEDREE